MKLFKKRRFRIITITLFTTMLMAMVACRQPIDSHPQETTSIDGAEETITDDAKGTLKEVWTTQLRTKETYIRSITEHNIIIFGANSFLMTDYSSLYCIDRITGNIVWEVKATGSAKNYLSFLSEEETLTYVGSSHSEYSLIECIDNISGTTLWRRTYKQRISDMTLADEAIVTIGNINSSNYLVATDAMSDNTLFQVEISQDCILHKGKNLHHIVIQDMGGVYVYNRSGEKLYELKCESYKPGRHNDIFYYSATPQIYEDKIWLSLKDEFVLLNLNNGKIDATIKKYENGESDLVILDNETVIIRNYSSHVDLLNFSVYSSDQEKILWERSDKARGIAKRNGNLYIVTKAKMICISLETGENIWETDISFKDIDRINRYIRPVIFKDIIILPNQYKVSIYDLENGIFISDMDGYILPWFEIDTEINDSYVVEDGNSVYILSKTEDLGYITRLDGNIN